MPRTASSTPTVPITLTSNVSRGRSVAFAHQRLGGQVEDHVGAGSWRRPSLSAAAIADVGLVVVAPTDSRTPEAEKLLGSVGGGSGVAGHLGAQVVQPDGQPRAFEARMAGDEHRAAGKRLGKVERHYHTFHGALPESHILFRASYSR